MSRKKHVLFASGEAVPFVKVGGLADVVTALAKALHKENFDIRIAIPKYRNVSEYMQQHNISPSLTFQSSVFINEVEYPFTVEKVHYNDCVFLFIDMPSFFDRSHPYTDPQTGRDYLDNMIRYVFFSKAVLQCCILLDWIPELIHCHDWHMGLIPLYKSALPEFKNYYTHTKTVFTIHNLAYQGVFPIEQYPILDLEWKYFQINGLEYYRHINFLKAGIIFSDAVNTVSKNYAEEIKRDGFGTGLEGIIQEKSRTGIFCGIMNGVDYTEWDPAIDPYLSKKYNINYDSTTIEKKDIIRQKFALEHKLALNEQTPLIGMITRLYDQKGLDIFFECVRVFLQRGTAFAILGTGKKEYEQLLLDLAEEFPTQIFIHIGFNIALSHEIEAASDIFLMPSNFEPCGLNQLYSLKYGTLPVVRSTGGLKDSVIDHQTGFVFNEYHPKALQRKLIEAITLWRNDKESWLTLMKNAMAEDWSWKQSAKGYRKLYERVLQKQNIL